MQFASMVITRFDIAQAITDKVTAGVDAYGITHSSVGTITWNDLVAGMAPGHMLANADSANSIMHHKYLIVDQENSNNDPLVWTGSHNWSNNANNKNDENTVIIHDQNIANQFYQEFYARFIENGGSIITGTIEQTG
jgi:phosphatidylserine/phosphatidylglycerophosphate/cardiolipin synthase-like enzyme